MQFTQALVPEKKKEKKETTSWMVFLGVIPILIPCISRTSQVVSHQMFGPRTPAVCVLVV